MESIRWYHSMYKFTFQDTEKEVRKEVDEAIAKAKVRRNATFSPLNDSRSFKLHYLDNFKLV